jgi:hypothetical protein
METYLRLAPLSGIPPAHLPVVAATLEEFFTLKYSKHLKYLLNANLFITARQRAETEQLTI